jgi:prepilin-type N-terminal cleavage/methylation domain-containing protein
MSWRRLLGQSSRAFTLIEVLVAIALLLALSGALSAMLFGLMERRDRVAIEASRQGAVDILFSEIDAALVGAFVEGPQGAGIRGDESSLRVLSRGVRVAPGSGLSDVIGLEFRHDEATGGILARVRWSRRRATSRACGCGTSMEGRGKLRLIAARWGGFRRRLRSASGSRMVRRRSPRAAERSRMGPTRRAMARWLMDLELRARVGMRIRVRPRAAGA